MLNRRIHAVWSGVAAVTAAVLVGCLAAVVPAARGAELKGAAEVIRAIREAEAAAPAGDAQSDPTLQAIEQLRRDLDAFAATQDDLPPEPAAAAWLGLWDRAAGLLDGPALARLREARGGLALQRFLYGGGPAGPLAAVIAVLPGPDAWQALAERVATRRQTPPEAAGAETSLRLLIAFLNQDPAAMDTALDQYAARLAELEDWRRENALQQTAALRRQAEQLRAGRTSDLVARFGLAIKAQRAAAGPPRSLRVPELVALAGEANAEALLREALAIPGVRLTIPGKGATLALAQRVALSLVGALKTPQWELVDSPNALELYEAMAKQFPDAPEAGAEATAPDAEFLERAESYREPPDVQAAQGRHAATLYYLLGLLARGRLDDAVACAARWAPRQGFPWVSGDRWSSDPWRSAAEWVEPPVLFEFYGRLVSQAPPAAQLPWREYVLLGIQLGRAEEPLRALEQACLRQGLASADRAALQGHLVEAYLARDDVDRAVALLRQGDPADGRSLPREQRAKGLDERLQRGTGLARLGRLLEKPEWVAAGIQMGVAAVDEALVAAGDGSDDALGISADGLGGYALVPFTELLIEGGRYPEAEALLRSLLCSTAKLEQRRNRGPEDFRPLAMAGGPLRLGLEQLVALYHAAGRHQDVLELLETSPWWGAADLRQVHAWETGGTQSGDLYVAVAAALHAAGRDGEAVAVLKELLYDSPANDRAYELLLAIGGGDLMAWLDRLYERDRFEERPLIWKAVLQLHAGRLADAEATARQALKVDPTDGEQKAGDRVRAYAVLADILRAQGRNEDAVFFRNVVRAVRLAEQGDEFAAAGLTQRSLGFYERAAALFLDAYCVQWRLAERLYAAGDRKGAEEHYRIAFERLPEQFGQVASLCFGCEGVFAEPQSRGVAEEVLSRLEKEGPKRPQVLYLLGQLRQAQGRDREAYDEYRRATAADPGYLDAWSRAYDLAEMLFLPPAERDAMALTMLRLDPLRRHAQVRLEEITHLKALAVVLRATRGVSVPRPATLLPLPASKAALAEAAETSPMGRDLFGGDDMVMAPPYADAGRIVPRLGEVLAGQETVQAILSLGVNP